MGGFVQSVKNGLDPLDLVHNTSHRGLGSTLTNSIDPGNIFGDNKKNYPGGGGLFKKGSHKKGMSAVEQVDYQQAKKYLDQYNSGKLTANGQEALATGDTNRTGTLLQALGNAGMRGSSAEGLLLGDVQKGTATHGFEAGKGSGIDLQMQSLKEQMLEEDKNIGLAYLGMSSGQAEDLALLQQQQAKLTQELLGKVGSALTSIMGSEATPGTGTGTTGAVYQEPDGHGGTYGVNLPF